MNERLLIDVGHSKPAIPVSAKSGQEAPAFPRRTENRVILQTQLPQRLWCKPHWRTSYEPRVRAELQTSKGSTTTLVARYGLNSKTAPKWRARQTTGDAAMGPRDPRNTVLSAATEAMIVEFRQHTLLPLGDVLGCLRDAIPS